MEMTFTQDNLVGMVTMLLLMQPGALKDDGNFITPRSESFGKVSGLWLFVLIAARAALCLARLANRSCKVRPLRWPSA
jgi:hypothetical protein